MPAQLRDVHVVASLWDLDHKEFRSDVWGRLSATRWEGCDISLAAHPPPMAD
jgi:hypothetical protein